MENFLLCGELSSKDKNGGGKNEGGFGLTVYKGRRRGTVEFFGVWKHQKSVKDMVANAVKIMHNLDHNNVLKFYEWYETSKHIWVITELASGGSLNEIIEQDGHIPLDAIEGFIKDIASGLHYLHSADIVYSDLQPKKVMLDTCESLKLSDFTLARLSHSSQDSDKNDFWSDAGSWFQLEEARLRSERTDAQTNSLPLIYLPSPFYAPPELYVGSAYSITTDMWSLGCVLFEMLTGRKPFCASSLESLEKAVCSHSVIDPGEVHQLGMWSKIIHGLLRKNPVKRFSWVELSSVVPLLAEFPAPS